MDLKIFTDNIEYEALNQIYTLAKQTDFANCKIRIMPDVHAGVGCVIGFTADLGDKVIPNIVGMDIGCGMLTVNLGQIDIDFERLDQVIRKYVPSGRNVHEYDVKCFDLTRLNCYKKLKNMEWIQQSIGTLGGGNHFIEIDASQNSTKYLVIHTGSRNLGKQVAEYYQNLAIQAILGDNDLQVCINQLIADYKAEKRTNEIENAIKNLKTDFKANAMKVPRDLCYLTDQNRLNYLHDMAICQEYAVMNRSAIANIILKQMKWKSLDQFETIHNYIDFKSSIVRKGAISAQQGETILIPINMKDGCILGKGKGNEDWNYSAPHGAGRMMSRSKAKETISLHEFQEVMQGVYTTSISASTIDESPMAYKPIQEIIANIADTVEITEIIKPIYNFKAGD